MSTHKMQPTNDMTTDKQQPVNSVDNIDNNTTTPNTTTDTETPLVTVATPISVKNNKKTRALTPKEKLFVKYLLDNPKATKTEAYKAAYDVKTDNNATIHPNASRVASKQQVQSALEANTQVFESVIVNTAKQWGTSEKTRERELALQASYYGHDKIHGKATQRVEQQSIGVTLTIDLTSSLGDTEE